MTFQTFATQKGIELLRDDIVYIKACLAKVHHKHRKAVLERYANTWLSAMSGSDIVHSRQNLGRRAANKQLGEL